MNKNIKCSCAFADYLRTFAPVPGNDFRKLIQIELNPGEEVREHDHHGHTILFYPADASPLVVKPKAGMIVYLPPRTLHSVPPVPGETVRVSMAMIIEPA